MFSPLLDGHGLLWLYHLQTQFLWPDKIRSLSGQSSRGFSLGFSLKCWSRHIKPIRGWLWMVPTMLCTACAVSWLLYRHKCRLLSFCKICQMHGTASPAGLTRCISQGRRNMLAEKVCGLSADFCLDPIRKRQFHPIPTNCWHQFTMFTCVHLSPTLALKPRDLRGERRASYGRCREAAGSRRRFSVQVHAVKVCLCVLIQCHTRCRFHINPYNTL
jgi:hypothetical protein